MTRIDAAWTAGGWSWLLSLALLARCYLWRPRLPWFVAWIALETIHSPALVWLQDYRSTVALGHVLKEWTAPVAAAFFVAAFVECAWPTSSSTPKALAFIITPLLFLLPHGFERPGFHFVPAQTLILLVGLLALIAKRPRGYHQWLMALFCSAKAVGGIAVLLGAWERDSVFEWECFSMSCALLLWLFCIDQIAVDSRLKACFRD